MDCVEEPLLQEPELESSRAKDAMASALRILWTNRKILLWVLISSAIASTIAALLMTPQFRSVARIMPPQQGAGRGLSLLANMAGGGAASASAASDILGFKSPGALYVGILKCRTIQDRVIEQFQLRSVYKTRTVDLAREALAAHTTVEEDRRSGIIAVAVTDTDPRRASAIARAYADNLNYLLSRSSTSSARQERIFLEERLKQIKLDLDAAQQKLSQFSVKNRTLDMKEQAHAMVDAVSKLQAQLVVARTELQGMEQIYSPNNVRVRAARARVAELESSLSDLNGKVEASDGRPIKDFPTLRELPTLGVSYADLYRQVAIDESVYELLTKQWELARVQEARELPSAELLDEPEVPERKASPSRRLVFLGGTMSSLLFAIGWLFAREYWRRLSSADPLKCFVEEALQDVRHTGRAVLNRVTRLRHQPATVKP